MKFGSLFAVAELGKTLVSVYWIKRNQAFPKKADGNFLKLSVPFGVLSGIGNSEVIRRIVVLVKVDVMHHFTISERRATFGSSDYNMLRDISSASCIWMERVENVIVAISKTRSLASLSLGLCRKYSTALPRMIETTGLVSFGSLPALDTHLLHCTPYNLLTCFVLCCDLMLGHLQRKIIPDEVFFSEWNGVCVLIAHAGIVTDSSNIRKEVVSC